MSAHWRPAPQYLFDLDNVLHDALACIMPQISLDMNAYLVSEFNLDADQASQMRTRLWHQYGATLTGLQTEYPGFDSVGFLRQTHHFPDLAAWVRQHNPGRKRIAQMLRQLPRRPVIVTNAPREYAKRLLKLLGLSPFLRCLVSIEDMVYAGRWDPKPSRRMLARVCRQIRVDPAMCVHVEDTYVNLKPARALRMRTVYVRGHLRRHARTYPNSRHLHTGVSRAVGLQVQSALTLRRSKLRR